jgi:hypothetical protein
MIYYHATTEENYQHMIDEGYLRGPVHLCDEYEYACQYGDVMLEIGIKENVQVNNHEATIEHDLPVLNVVKVLDKKFKERFLSF